MIGEVCAFRLACSRGKESRKSRLNWTIGLACSREGRETKRKCCLLDDEVRLSPARRGGPFITCVAAWWSLPSVPRDRDIVSGHEDFETCSNQHTMAMIYFRRDLSLMCSILLSSTRSAPECLVLDALQRSMTGDTPSLQILMSTKV